MHLAGAAPVREAERRPECRLLLLQHAQQLGLAVHVGPDVRLQPVVLPELFLRGDVHKSNGLSGFESYPCTCKCTIRRVVC